MPTKTDRRISEAYAYGTRQDLELIQIELLNERKKLADFIDMFLDKYDTKMTLMPPEHATWQLFRSKHAAYGELERLIKATNYFIAKTNVSICQ